MAVAGAILCAAWRSLITSFGQLNRGKFQVINTIERYLKTAIYAAEWEALGRGENPKVYRPFTSREIWVPNALLVLYMIRGSSSGTGYCRGLHFGQWGLRPRLKHREGPGSPGGPSFKMRCPPAQEGRGRVNGCPAPQISRTFADPGKCNETCLLLGSFVCCLLQIKP